MAQGFAIEDDVAGRVAEALRAKLLPAQRRPVDAAAYADFIKGKAAAMAHAVERVRAGQALLKLALERAPDFSQGWSELAKAYCLGGFWQPASAQVHDAALGREAAKRGYTLDPSNGAAYAAYAALTPRRHTWAEVDDGLAKGAGALTQ